MTPKEAYDDISGRAWRLYRLHHGMINTRSRRIRSDWRQSFCKLMRWRLSSQLERVDSRDAIVVLRDSAGLVPDDFSQDNMDDLLRSALALGVSALDRYVHERVVKNIIKALSSKGLCRRQQDLSIPAVVALEAATRIRRAAKDNKQARAANEIRNRIQEDLHIRPFQSWRQIEEAFELIGVKGLKGTLQSGYAVGSFEPIERQLNSIVDRRNKIVHEGDLLRHARGGTVRRKEISPKLVHESLEFLDGFVDILDQISGS